ncbi:MAG: phosphorylcholine metabolism protein LicD [Saprospiraceae bacterium]|jgi:phosphorylcholine metabolism protein LicD
MIDKQNIGETPDDVDQRDALAMLLDQLIGAQEDESPPKISKPLLFMLKFLEKRKINYWVDSGSLLGIVRDGGLMSWDSDIDLGMWPEDAAQFQEYIEFLRSRFLVVKERYYLGHLYGFTIKPAIGVVRTKEIHIHVFYRTKLDVAWSPQTVRPRRWDFDAASDTITPKLTKAYVYFESYSKGRVKGGKLKKSFLKLLSWPAMTLARSVKSRMDRYLWAKKRPFSDIYRSGTWLIKSSYFDTLTEMHWLGQRILIPSDVEAYLEDRYGDDWREPNPDWIYYADDGCLKAGGPEVVLPELYRSNNNADLGGESMVDVLGIHPESLHYFKADA